MHTHPRETKHGEFPTDTKRVNIGNNPPGSGPAQHCTESGNHMIRGAQPPARDWKYQELETLRWGEGLSARADPRLI